jgi:hypothetical protein
MLRQQSRSEGAGSVSVAEGDWGDGGGSFIAPGVVGWELFDPKMERNRFAGDAAKAQERETQRRLRMDEQGRTAQQRQFMLRHWGSTVDYGGSPYGPPSPDGEGETDGEGEGEGETDGYVDGGGGRGGDDGFAGGDGGGGGDHGGDWGGGGFGQSDGPYPQPSDEAEGAGDYAAERQRYLQAQQQRLQHQQTERYQRHEAAAQQQQQDERY